MVVFQILLIGRGNSIGGTCRRDVENKRPVKIEECVCEGGLKVTDREMSGNEGEKMRSKAMEDFEGQDKEFVLDMG